VKDAADQCSECGLTTRITITLNMMEKGFCNLIEHLEDAVLTQSSLFGKQKTRTRMN